MLGISRGLRRAKSSRESRISLSAKRSATESHPNCNGVQQSCNIEFGRNPTPGGRECGFGEESCNKPLKGCEVMQNGAVKTCPH